MIKEKDIRGIYEGFYRIAEIVGDNDYTKIVNRQLHLLLTNTIALTTHEEQDKHRELIRIIGPLSKDYYSKFEKLSERQRASN